MTNIRNRLYFAALALLCCINGSSAHEPPASPPMAEAGGAIPLLAGMGGYSMAITTRHAGARRYFDQGLMLAWGFHFAAAQRSFSEAARLDPQCAMCRWGIAYAFGPSINHDPQPAQLAAAREAVLQAQGLAERASERERALIDALVLRYPASGPADDAAYASAMAELVRRDARDADLLTLYAEALMAPRGRDYWTRSGQPRPWTPEIVAELERALAISPRHPGALHFHVHVLEDSPRPERALASADALVGLAPGLGHLLHMPAHIYFRVGRYADAIAANERAIEADARLSRALGDDPAYLLGYALHNHHYLWTAALMSGRVKAADGAAQALARHTATAVARGAANGTLQHFASLPMLTDVRFGRWEAILATPRAAPGTAYIDGIRHFARAMAYARTRRAEEARAEIAQLDEARLRAAREGSALKNVHPLDALLAIAEELARAELAAASGRRAEGVQHARRAVALESRLENDEPPAWPLPARHTLGALLLEMGRAPDAQQVYRDDLLAYPENVWSLAGMLGASRKALPRAQVEAKQRLERATAGAEASIGGSRH